VLLIRRDDGARMSDLFRVLKKMDLPKSKAKKVEFFFKGFPEDVRFKSHTVPESMERAKGTLYETWFNALKLSPYYQLICETHEYPSEEAEKTFHLFGDVRNTTFEKWWITTGYGIFAEKKPFNRVGVSNEKNDVGEDVPILRLEIPLNVSPKTLRNQFNELLEIYHPHYQDFDRWQASTAEVKLQSRKFTSASLDLCLDVYAKYVAKANKSEVLLYEIGEELRINPKLNVVRTDRPSEVAEKHIKMSSSVSEYLEKAKNLVAHATEGRFPCADNHRWVERQKRGGRKSKYSD
jgi:hypothetical protein